MFEAIDEGVISRARRIRLLTCDVDGVLTDGTIYVGADGNEYKAFSVLDGVGLKRLHEIGVMVAWLSGSKAPAIAHRARALGVARVTLGIEDKLAPWDALRNELGLDDGQCAHIGDDLPDMPVLARCGLAVSVPNAMEEVKSIAHLVTARPGGNGAVREVCDLLLDAQGAPRRYAISGA